MYAVLVYLQLSDRLQISILILSDFKRIKELPSLPEIILYLFW